MTNSSRGLVILGASAVLLALAWQIFPPASTPLYDGLTLPLERYRYLHPPSGYRPTKPPSAARTVVRVIGGTTEYANVQTDEQPPQAWVVLDDRAIHPPPGTKQVTVTVRPVPPPAALPNGRLDSNVYQVEGRLDRRSLSGPIRGQSSVVLLRAADPQSSPVMEVYRRGRWTVLKVRKMVSEPSFVARLSTFGYYALVLPGGPHRTGGTQSAGDSVRIYAVVLAGIVVLLGGLIIALRLLRRPSPETPQAP